MLPLSMSLFHSVSMNQKYFLSFNCKINLRNMILILRLIKKDGQFHPECIGRSYFISYGENIPFIFGKLFVYYSYNN